MAGEPFSSRGRHVLASNGLLHEQMLQIVRDFQGKSTVAG
jgi:hypothetical protein